MSRQITLIGIEGVPEIHPRDDLANLLVTATENQGTPFMTGDIVVIAQKAISKAEGRLVSLKTVTPSSRAVELSKTSRHSPELLEVILQEARCVIRAQEGVIITETHHGLRCANSGVDTSNVMGDDLVALLPKNPDVSARRLRAEIRRKTGKRVAVVVSDTFGRPWREGATNVAIGIAGLAPLRDYRGEQDSWGRTLQSTVIAVADELAGAAELVTDKLKRIPAIIVRGYEFAGRSGHMKELLRESHRDLFP